MTVIDRTKFAKILLEPIEQKRIGTVVGNFAEDATLLYPGNVPGSGIWRGKQQIRRFFEILFRQFESISFEIRDFAWTPKYADGIHAVVMFVASTVTTINNGERTENDLVSHVTINVPIFHIVDMRDYFYSLEGLRRGWGVSVE